MGLEFKNNESRLEKGRIRIIANADHVLRTRTSPYVDVRILWSWRYMLADSFIWHELERDY